MPVPVFRHHDAAKIRVTAEVNAEQIEDLALVKVRGGPDRGNALNGCLVAIKADDQTQPLFQRHRKDVVDDLEARLGGIPVDGGNVFEEVVAGLPHSFTRRDDVLAGDGDGQLGAVDLCI